MCRQHDELDSPSIEERAGTDKKCIGSLLRQRCEGRFDLTRCAGVEENEFQAGGIRRRSRISDNPVRNDIGRIDKHRHASGSSKM